MELRTQLVVDRNERLNHFKKDKYISNLSQAKYNIFCKGPSSSPPIYPQSKMPFNFLSGQHISVQSVFTQDLLGCKNCSLRSRFYRWKEDGDTDAWLANWKDITDEDTDGMPESLYKKKESETTRCSNKCGVSADPAFQQHSAGWVLDTQWTLH